MTLQLGITTPVTMYFDSLYNSFIEMFG